MRDFIIVVIILDGLNGRDAGHAGRHQRLAHVDREEAVEVLGCGGWVGVNIHHYHFSWKICILWKTKTLIFNN